jgi:hypothetical protein
MKIFLIFFSLAAPPNGWHVYSVSEWATKAECDAYAARWNADQPFERDNQDYLACEPHYGRIGP